jgi:hypothetical protein
LLEKLSFDETVLELCWDGSAEALADNVAAERFEREGFG